jgi:O-antigen ligase
MPSVFPSLGTGLLLGGGALVLGLLTAIGGPIAGFGALIGFGVAFYVLTDLMAGLYLTLFTMALLPFATIPVRIALTPTLIDFAMGAFLLVYLFQYMTGRRIRPRFVPAHLLIIAFMLFMLLSFLAGLNNGLLTTKILRKFAEMQLSIGFAIVLVDVLRDKQTLRRAILVLILAGAAQATLGMGLWLLNDATAERLLNALGRFGYPQGGVIRYVEENPDLAERAIGTWIDPNAYGGFLVVVGAVTGAQLLSKNPVTRWRWVAFACFLPIAGALLLTQSRGAFVALGAAVLFVAILRYRWLIPLMILGGVIFLLLPFTQEYIERFVQGLQNQDLATQMRFGEYKDALILITRYPLIGVGYTGTPDRDLYLGVSSMYLIIASNTGLVGLGLYLALMVEAFRYGFVRWGKLAGDPGLQSIWLGTAAALLGLLVGGVFDHFSANIEFSGSVLMLWVVVGLVLATARLSEDETLPPLTAVPLR